jgi:hypothetical protein
MARRSSVAILGGIMMLVVGIIGLSNAAESAESNALNSGNNSAEAYNATEGVFNGLGQAMGPGVAMMGIAAFVLIALAYLYASMQSGR